MSGAVPRFSASASDAAVSRLQDACDSRGDTGGDRAMTIETDISGDASGLISLGSWLSAAPGGRRVGCGRRLRLCEVVDRV